MLAGEARLPLAFEEAGQGTPLVLLHGFPLNRDLFSPILPALAQLGRVVAVDLPGFGGSPPLPCPFTLGQMADAVWDLLDRLQLPSCVLAGHSMGGYVALEMAARRPESLRALILLASHPQPDSPEALARRQEGVRLIREGRRQEFLHAFLARLLAPSMRARQPRLAAEVAAMAATVPDEVLVGCLQAMAGRADHRPTLARLQVPLLVLVGEEDALIPPELAAATAQHACRGQLERVPLAGHLPPMEMPVATGEALARFLRSVVG